MALAAKYWKATAAAFAGVVLVGCGGETPGELQSTMQAAAETIEFGTAGDSECLGDAIFDTVGFDTLVADGHTTESVALDEEGSIDAIFDKHRSDALDDALASCLDADDRFRSELGSQHLSNGVQCEDTFDTDTPLVADFVDAVVAGEDTTITIDDTPELRTFIRSCATDDDFAAVFGLQTAAELATRIDTSFGSHLRTDKQPCAGAPIVDSVGFERMNEIGIGIDGAAFSIDSLELDDQARNKLINTISSCTDHIEQAETRYRIAEPYFGACVLESVTNDDEWIRRSTERGLNRLNRDRTVERIETSALDSCVEHRITEVYGENKSSTRLAARQFAAGLVEGIKQDDPDTHRYGTTEAEYQCMAYGLFDQIGVSAVYEATDVLAIADFESLEYWEASDTIWTPMTTARRECVGDWLFLSGDLHRAGFEDETLGCLRSELDGYGEFADLITTDVNELSDDEFWEYAVEFDNWYFAFTDGLEGCYQADEQQIFDDYIGWLEGFENVDAQELTET